MYAIILADEKEDVMDVTRYTFQSPYPNQIQIGRPDTSVKKDENSDNPAVGKTEDYSLKTTEAVQPKEVTPSVKSEQLLDTYV